MWELIVGGVILASIVAGITLSLNYAKQRGRAEAERDASEEARKLENEMRGLAGQKLTAEEIIERIRNKKFGEPKS